MLDGRVPGRSGGYQSAIRVIDAQRSLVSHHRAVLLRLVGGDYVHRIGVLDVRCGQTPMSRFAFSAQARAFGGPAISHDSTVVTTRAAVARSVASNAGTTRLLDTAAALNHAARAVVEHYSMSLGGEAVQYRANITAILVPANGRCITSANATVVEHFAGVIGTH